MTCRVHIASLRFSSYSLLQPPVHLMYGTRGDYSLLEATNARCGALGGISVDRYILFGFMGTVDALQFATASCNVVLFLFRFSVESL